MNAGIFKYSSYSGARSQNSGVRIKRKPALVMVIKEKISVVVSVDRWLSSYNFF